MVDELTMDEQVLYAGFWRRFVAYWIDSLPITLVVAFVFYVFFGFDTALARYVERGPRDHEARQEFLTTRNLIRDVSMALYLAYSALADASPLRGTLGKRLVGIKVVRKDGSPLTLAQALHRNCAKVLSFLICGLGCLWVAWSPHKQGWHDMIAGTLVIQRTKED
jgi:uncharacterized RDD family membrane protein YckC